ncbi:MAG: dihydrofolate reductase [Ruminococcus sp.]
MIALIAAYTKNKVIGKDGKIPWNLRNEKKRFKELTTGNVVVMGRKTYEEIGRPLPNRNTIVVSKTRTFDFENCMTARTVEEALKIAKEKFPHKDVYISGGGEIYKEVLPYAQVMYITEINSVINGDVYFPDFDEKDFDVIVEAKFNEELPYTYLTYTRKV